MTLKQMLVYTPMSVMPTSILVKQVAVILMLIIHKVNGHETMTEMEFEKSDRYYDPKAVPEKDHYYMPVQCQHCRNAPCVKACPVKATWTEPDGIVVVDYDWCIGCRYCMAACPYGARHFNWKKPGLPAPEMNPETHYLGNRPRPVGVVEKCTFCIQRVRNTPGRYTACVEVCPVKNKSEARLKAQNKDNLAG